MEQIAVATLLALIVAASPASADGTPEWLQPPQLAIMTGFIFDPPTGDNIEAWAEGLGSNFDAREWVGQFSEAGASYVIFYDKWIDGLVFHDTDTTYYETPRDYLREVSDACEDAGLPLVVYWNAACDNNPEFVQYATLDEAGKPIRFPEPWPCAYLSVHSPFRQVGQDQVREILSRYTPISGLWLDICSQPIRSTDPYTTAAFTDQYGLDMSEAASGQLAQFQLDTLGDYLAELRGIAGEQQPGLQFTTNGSAMGALSSPLFAARIASQLGFLSVEGHGFSAMDSQAAAADVLSRSMETGDLVSSSWFTPLEPMADGRGRRALAEAAIAWCQGANVYFAITPNYDGVFGEGEIEAIREAGEWLHERRDLLAASRSWPDVGIILGHPMPPAGPVSLSELWGMPVVSADGPWGEAYALLRALNGLGYGGRVICEMPGAAEWPSDLSRFRTLIVPDRAALSAQQLRRLRRYVQKGGRLLVFGNGTRVGADGVVRDHLAHWIGLRTEGAVAFPPEAGPSSCYADSEYGQGYHTRNLADGTPACWASAATPMPHWAQVNLPIAQPVARVRVAARPGGYVLRDFDILTWDGADWDTAVTCAGNEEAVVDCVLDAPITTLGIRVHVRAATLGGEPRELADIEEIEVYGPQGALLSGQAGYRLGLADEPGRDIAGPALAVEATSAAANREFTDPASGARHPLVTTAEVGDGVVTWVATRAEAFVSGPGLDQLARQAIGRPTISGQYDQERYRTVLRQVAGRLLICAVDSRPELPADSIRLRVVSEGQTVTLVPDPAATLLID